MLRRVDKLWAIPAAIILLLVGLMLRPELKRLFGSSGPSPAASASAAPDPASASPSASTEQTVAAPTPAKPGPAPAPAPEPSTAEPSEPRPSEVQGKDADTWRLVLHGAVMRGDAAVSLEALSALATIDPTRFDDPKVLSDAVTAAHLAAATNEDLGQKMFELLGGNALGHAGPDVLYRIMSLHGGSRAAKRATELLARDDIMKLATPALLIAMALRDAACSERSALLDRAAKEGDERALYLLLAMRGGDCGQTGCCIKNDSRLDVAILAIRERMSKQ